MKTILLGLFGVLCLVVGSHSITVNPASAVTADSANTGLTIPYRDADGAFSMGALTATSVTNTGAQSAATGEFTTGATVGIPYASKASTAAFHVAGGASVTGNLQTSGNIGAGGAPGGAGVPLRVEGAAQFNEAGDATNFVQIQASGDDIYYDSWGTAANSGGHKFRVSDGSKIALTLDATGGASMYSRTKAQLLTISAPIGALYYCSDCADATSSKPTVVIATGTSAGNFGTIPIGVFQ